MGAPGQQGPAGQQGSVGPSGPIGLAGLKVRPTPRSHHIELVKMNITVRLRTTIVALCSMMEQNYSKTIHKTKRNLAPLSVNNVSD